MIGKSAYCKVSISPIRAENKDQAEIVSQLLFGEIITINEIQENWVNITTLFDAYSGWIDVKHLKRLSDKELKRWLDGLSPTFDFLTEIKTPWGNQRLIRGSYLPNENQFNIGNDSFEIINSSKDKLPSTIFETALSYLNAPYLWGGKQPFGIDCSGFTQMVYRFHGFNLPRDASQQVEIGQEIELEDIIEGDIAFFHNKNGKIIHVGILDGKGHIIHASGCVRIDTLTKEGIVHSESNTITHYLNCIKRV